MDHNICTLEDQVRRRGLVGSRDCTWCGSAVSGGRAKLKTVKTDAINKLIREAAVDPLQKQLLASRWEYTRFFADCLCDLSFEESPPAMGD